VRESRWITAGVAITLLAALGAWFVAIAGAEKGPSETVWEGPWIYASAACFLAALAFVVWAAWPRPARERPVSGGVSDRVSGS
jgi:hypothetical protein